MEYSFGFIYLKTIEVKEKIEILRKDPELKDSYLDEYYKVTNFWVLFKITDNYIIRPIYANNSDIINNKYFYGKFKLHIGQHGHMMHFVNYFLKKNISFISAKYSYGCINKKAITEFYRYIEYRKRIKK